MRAITARLLALATGAALLTGLGLGAPAHAATFGSTLTPGTQLVEGDQLWSPARQHRIWIGPNIGTEGIVLDGDSCDLDVLASTATHTSQTRFVMQTDGNLVFYVDGHAWWHTGTHGNPGAYAVLQDDRNLVVYSPAGRALWQSGTACSTASNVDGLIGDPWAPQLKAGQFMQSPNRQYKLIMQTDGNLVLYRGIRALWQSNTRGTGNTFTVETNNDLTVRKADGTRLWRSGTATGNVGGWPPAVTLRVQDDGNVVLYRNPDGPTTVPWNTRTQQR